METEKLYTKGLRLLGKEVFEFEGREICAHIYKSRTRNKSKKRFLVWFPEQCTCSMVWKDRNININDVSKTSDGKNWYSYADRDSRAVIGANTAEDYVYLAKFSQLLFDKHELLLESM